MTSMTVLSQGQRAHVTHVVHIADTHIRTGDRVSARVDEYRHVLGNLREELEGMEAVRKGTALMVIAGDVFHHKGRLETEGALVIYEWLNEVLQLLPVLVICGNHDFRQEDPGYTDMIEMLVAPYAVMEHRHPIHYLKDTGHYVWENLSFGLTSVKDTLKAYNTFGILADLPAFPNPEGLTGCRIALFHGSVTQSAMPNGAQVADYSHGYPLEWFRGYEIAMLGDNHTQQLHTGLDGTLAWGYPGSLVQQDGGEPLLGHGYILWDIAAREGKMCHIHNDYATVNLYRAKDGTVMARPRPRESMPLSKALTAKWFPKSPQVRVVGAQGDDTLVAQALKKLGVRPSRLYLSKTFSAVGAVGAGSAEAVVADGDAAAAEGNETRRLRQLADLNSPEKWRSFVLEQVPEMDEEALSWLSQPGKLLLPEGGLPSVFTDKISARNKAIQKMIDAYENSITGMREQGHHIILKHMEWEYIMCYGPGNWFDFSHMDHRVALLNGKNASGKSSFLDVLCLAIFGEATAMRSDIHGSKMSVKVIHDKKPATKHDNAYVKLLFSVDGDTYEVKRSFTVKSKDEVLQSKVNKIATVHRVEDGSLVLIADGTTMVNEWMSKRFGTLPEVLMSTMLCQMDNSNFFLQKEADQVLIIEKALHMETIHAYECILHEALKMNKYALQEVTTYMQGLMAAGGDKEGSGADARASMEALEEALKGLAEKKERLKKLEAKKKKLSEASNSILVNIQGAVDNYGYELEEAEEGLQKEQENVDRYPGMTPEMAARAHAEQERLAEEAKRLGGVPRASCGIGEAQEGLVRIEKALRAHERKRPEDEPTITQTYIEQKEYEHTAWRNTVAYMEIDPEDGLEPRIAELLLEQKRLYAEQEALRVTTERPTRPKQGYAAWKKKWEEWSTFAAGVSEMTTEELDQRSKDVSAYLSKMDETVQEAKVLAERVATLKEERGTYKDVEFNEHCSACQKNPLRKRLEAINKELKAADTRYKRAQKKLEGMEPTRAGYMAELEDIRSARPDRASYEARLPLMEQERAEWDSSMGLWEQEEQRERQRELIAASLKVLFEELQLLQKVRTEHEMWVKERERIEEGKDALAMWAEWNSRQQALMEEKAGFENLLAWEHCEEATKKNRALLESIQGYESAVRERDEWQNIVLSIHWQKSWSKLEVVTKECSKLQAEVAVLDAGQQKALERARLLQGCEEALVAIQGRMKRLQALIGTFVGEKGGACSGFKAWVYRTEVVPLLENEVNAFLAPLEDFRFVVRYHNGALLYSLNDRGNQPTLDHASGYQRFIVGLAMRIALARIGAVGQNIRHLFMDEGFVACDSSNIAKVETILHSMMEVGGYRSVLLMSHLDAIREIAQTRIDIRRSEDNLFSMIAWGTNYPSFKKNKKMDMAASPKPSTGAKRNIMKKLS